MTEAPLDSGDPELDSGGAERRPSQHGRTSCCFRWRSPSARRRETISRALPPRGVDVTGRSLLAWRWARLGRDVEGDLAHFIGIVTFLEVCPVIIVQSQLTGAI